MKKIIVSIALLAISLGLFAQNITTASAYFKTVSEQYATFKDYEADFEFSVDGTEMAGHFSYKTPNLIRLDFTNPEQQVIVFNGDLLTIYLPGSDAVLLQNLDESTTDDDENLTTLGSPKGLSLLSRYYTVAYETGQDAELLEEGSDEMVVKLILTKKSAAEAFRYIKLCISEKTKLLRRMEAVTPKGQTYIFNYYDYKINQDISDQRFIYEAPSSANNFNNFLFTD